MTVEQAKNFIIALNKLRKESPSDNPKGTGILLRDICFYKLVTPEMAVAYLNDNGWTETDRFREGKIAVFTYKNKDDNSEDIKVQVPLWEEFSDYAKSTSYWMEEVAGISETDVLDILEETLCIV